MVYLLRLTMGDRGVVVVCIDGKPPETFVFDTAYDALLFERLIGSQIEFITHGRTKLVAVAS